jgi:hypothetical protein
LPYTEHKKVTALVVVIGLIAVTSLISTMSGLWGVLVPVLRRSGRDLLSLRL